MDEWTFTQEHNSKGEMIYYAAPKPYKYGFITSPSEEGRRLQYEMVLQSERECVEDVDE